MQSQRVASTLLNRGRLPISTLKHLSATPLATTQAAVLTLIQHNLVKYCGVTGEDEVPVGGDQFEFETWECLMRLRWGRILAATERDFSKEQDREATKIIQLVLMSGKLTAPHIIAHFTNQLVDPTEIAKSKLTDVQGLTDQKRMSSINFSSSSSLPVISYLRHLCFTPSLKITLTGISRSVGACLLLSLTSSGYEVTFAWPPVQEGR